MICNKAPFPSNDGSSIAIANMAKGLLQNGVKLDFLVINTKKHFKPDSAVPKEIITEANYKSVYKNTGTSFHGALLNLFSSDSYFVSRFFFKTFKNQLIETLLNNEFDIVQLEGLFMGKYIDVIRKYSRAKIILRAHNIEHLIWERHIPNEKSFFRKKYLSLQNKRLEHFERLVTAEVDGLVPITANDASEFTKMGCTKPLYPCIAGVDVKVYQEKTNFVPKPGTVFYFGSMDWLPNQEAVTWFLNNCWEKIHKALPQAKFLIAGRGMPLHFFHITKPNVSIIENVDDGKAFFQQHQLMVVPLLSGSGLRIKIIEGMSYGKAIVSTSIGAEGIDYTDGTNIVIANEPDVFAEKVIELLNNVEKRTLLERNASEFAMQEFDNSQVVKGLVGFYNQIING